MAPAKSKGRKKKSRQSPSCQLTRTRNNEAVKRCRDKSKKKTQESSAKVNSLRDDIIKLESNIVRGRDELNYLQTVISVKCSDIKKYSLRELQSIYDDLMKKQKN